MRSERLSDLELREILISLNFLKMNNKIKNGEIWFNGEKLNAANSS